MAAAHTSHKIRGYLKEWAERYRIEYCVRSTLHEHRYWIEVEFLRPEDLTLFALTWHYKTFMRWQRVKDLQ